MIKKIALTIIAVLAIGIFSATAVTNTVSTQSAQSAGTASMETMRVSALFNSLAQQTAYFLDDNNTPSEEDMYLYVDTLQRIATYADSKVPLTAPDLNLLVDSFYDFTQAGGEAITKEEIREDFGRFSTLGEVVDYLSQALLSGL